MKRIASIALIVGVLILAFGVFASAGGISLFQTAMNNIRGDITANTDARLVGLEEAIQTKIGSTLQDVRNSQTQRANTEITNYINQQIANIETSPELNDALNAMVQETTAHINAEKARVDAIIVATLNGN